MVFPLEAVRMSPGRMAFSETMFSQAATMKWASTPSGFSWAIAWCIDRQTDRQTEESFNRKIWRIAVRYGGGGQAKRSQPAKQHSKMV